MSSILVHVYSGGKTMEDTPITFDEAMFLVEHQDTFHEDKENFLGFTAPEHEDAVIQFVREDENRWLIDIPVVKIDTYKGSFHTVANHSQTVAMITHFFISESELRQAIVKQNYDLLSEALGSNWGLGIHMIESEE